MSVGITTVAGISVPSIDPLFLYIVALHVLLGLLATVSGAIAMLSPKRAGRHPRAGRLYFWSVTGIFATATALSVIRWTDDYHLFVLGALSFMAAVFGRTARRRRICSWARLHIAGMGSSYILLLTASCPCGENCPPGAIGSFPQWWAHPSCSGRC